ncbi:MAG: hypothetical protein AB9869_35265 [Verrucomicrobiia bacterium]
MQQRVWLTCALVQILIVSLVAPCVSAADNQPLFKPGTLLKVYELKRGTSRSVVQEGDALFETVDRSSEFRVGNFRNREGIDLPKGKPVAAKWEGYLKVDKPGTYLFLAGPKTGTTTLIILINNERLLEGSKPRNPATATVDLPSGVHQVKLWLAGSGGGEKASASIQWRHRDDKDFKEIKPGSLLHREN